MKRFFIENLFWIAISVTLGVYHSGIPTGLLILILWLALYYYAKYDASRKSKHIRPTFFTKPQPEPLTNKDLDSYEFTVNQAAIEIARYRYLSYCHLKKQSIFRETPKHDSEIDGGYDVFISEWFKDAEPIYFHTFKELNGKPESSIKDEIKKARKDSVEARKYYFNQFNAFKNKWLAADPQFPSNYNILYWLHPNYS
jgi:hypothetical protein